MSERSRDDRRREDRAERVARSLAWLARYESLVDEKSLFLSALDQPPPVDLLILPQRRSVDAAAAGLARRGLKTSRFACAPWHLRVETSAGAGALPEVNLGFAQPQGVASALAPQLLAPQPGERVLDLCAAPGGKTVLLDALSGGAATILAGEASRGRTGVLVQTLARAGAPAIVVQQDGQSFPQVGPFDAILVDAPCTGEGTFRAPSPRYDPTGEEGLQRAAAVQKRLLSRALDLLAPGGRLVYSTCAYSPEENEAVLDAVLTRRDDIEIETPPAGFPGSPGVRRWGGKSYLPAVERARRLLPHHLGSWGFFIARLRKSPDAARPAAAPAPSTMVNPEVGDFLVREFGVLPEELAAFVFARRGRDYWVRPRASLGVDLDRMRVVAPGLRAARSAAWGFTPTNGALRWLGARVRRRVVDVDFDAAVDLLEGASLPVPESGDSVAVAVRVEGAVVGRGILREGRVSLEIPRGWR